MTHPVDEVLPPGRLLVLAIQHVLTMYAGAVTVPLVISSALHLGADQTAYLVSSDLVACGLVTLIQCIGLGVGLIPVADGRFFDKFPPAVATFLHNGVMLGIVTAVLLNLLLNREQTAETATTETLGT